MASKKGKAKTDGPSIQPYCEALKASNVTGPDNKVIRKWEAAIQVWSYALGGEDEREEIFKTGCLPNLLGLLERGEPDEKYAAIGALHALAASEKHVSEVITNKALASAAVLLAGDQPRVKLPASQFLALAAARPEYANRVADVALAVLVDTAKQGGPGWGQMRQTLMHCVAALRLLLENVEGEPSDVKQSRRLQVINGGAVPALVHMVAYQPRLPDPEEVPAPPPKPVKKSSSKKASSKDQSKGPMLGHKDSLATSAAACLRFLALCPSFVEELTGSGCLPEIIHALLSANAEQAAFIAGVLWEICAEEAVARKAMDLKVVPALLHVASRFCAGMGGKKKKGGKKKSKGKDEPAPKKKEDRRAEPAPPPPINFAEVAVCNAAGALHHLTFLDDAKVQVGQLNGVAIMAACLKSPSPQVYENVTGVLWNVGLHIANGAALEDAGAPEYLVHPVPERWMLYEDEEASASDGSGVSSQEDNGVRDAVFMTQQPPL